MSGKGYLAHLITLLNTESAGKKLLITEQEREEEAVSRLLQDYALSDALRARTLRFGETLITGMRNQQRNFSLEPWLQEYGLDNQEGLTLMQLAEALLRIPDQASAEQFISDKLQQASWKSHLGQSESLWVNASTFGLDLGADTLSALSSPEGFGAGLKQVVQRLGKPLILSAAKKAMQGLASHFIVGQSIEDALTKAPDSDTSERIQHCCSFDMLGEAAMTDQDALRYHRAYTEAIQALSQYSKQDQTGHSISIKLSALHPRYEPVQADALKIVQERLFDLVELAVEHDIELTLDAEESWRLETQLLLLTSLFKQQKFLPEHRIGIAVQAYQKRARSVLTYLNELARIYRSYIPVRLVKGAYWDTEIKHAQVHGLGDYPVFTRKASTDLNYLVCARELLNRHERLRPQFATHNAHTVASILAMAAEAHSHSLEFQRLYGMGTELYEQLEQPEFAEVGQIRCRTYAPVGSFETVLPYLIRRLLENGANSSFVHQMGQEKDVEQLLEDPGEEVSRYTALRNPLTPHPERLYGASRRNSRGIDLGLLCNIDQYRSELDAIRNQRWIIPPLATEDKDERAILSPANQEEVVARIPVHSRQQALTMFVNAERASKDWQLLGLNERCQILEQLATNLEANRLNLLSVLMREGGKCLHNAIAELREAVDFCLYYAAQGRKIDQQPKQCDGPTGETNTLELEARGTIVCISPWNFPLAIFVGQVSAALVAGNTVLARPASTTPVSAYLAVEAMHQAGVPKDVVQLLLCTAADMEWCLGQQDPLDGVLFTGSNLTAKRIQRTLAGREGALVPLIAETGGQNCLIADSSALPEQLVQDVVESAFDSAGQRCSALRVLYLQQEIFEPVIELLTGAMKQLRIGAPENSETDIGPLISREALNKLEHYVAGYRDGGKLLFQSKLEAGLSDGFYFAPCLLQAESLAQLQEEMFGPVLHVISYSYDRKHQIINEINRCGYGLTLGVHSRSECFTREVAERAKVGNVYINRNIIGATVGVQPFGGRGLSGTGPKAGGPNYLTRLMHEKTISINTAAAGGNVDLLN